MKYIVKNIRSFFVTEKMIFFLIMLCVITSSFIVNFSYGLYQNYNVVIEKENSEQNEIVIDINDSSAITKEKIRNCVISVSSETNDKIGMYYIRPEIKPFTDGSEYGLMDIRFTVKNSQILPCDIIYQNLKNYGNWKGGIYFSDEQEINGERVAIAREVNTISPENCYTTPITTRTEGAKRWIEVQGKEYEVIGYHSLGYAPYVPFESLDDDTTFSLFIDIWFEAPITRPQYNELKNKFEGMFGSAITFPVMDIPESENYYLYNTIIVISILIALLAAINFAVLYKYILSKRTKKLAVFRICGCTKAKAFTMFISECMLLMIPLFVATTIIYDRFILPKLGDHFEYIESAYSIKLYLLIFMIYIVASAFVLSFMISGFLSKSIREAKEEK